MGVSEQDTSELESDRLRQVCEQSGAHNYQRHEKKEDARKNNHTRTGVGVRTGRMKLFAQTSGDMTVARTCDN
jgi:hypothetical protein